ncbi:MAG: hypothetical protein QMC93_01265 [Patescibacteria group bacterium]|nr:hypothetical protein [Patescibacteria group bacterium]
MKTITEKEYSELWKVKDILERILRPEEKKPSKRDSFLKAFGILKNKIKGDSLDYVSKLRKEWRS